MNQSAVDHDHVAAPRAIVKKMRWPFPFIWLVPICALIAGGYYLYDLHQQRGTQITLTFDDAEGLRPGQTPVTVRGVQIGKVADVELAADQRHAMVHVDLLSQYSAVARAGALFWVVRPDFSNGTLTGLGTVVSGPYIEASPGVGEPQTQFIGLAKAPVSLEDGLILLLYSDHLEHLQADSPIYYRGIQVGVVQGVALSRDATHVEIHAVIRPPYAKLVTAGSKFWSVSGADVKGGIFSGISVRLDSLRALLSGGIAFATPQERSPKPAKDGDQFPVYEEPDKDWLSWAPVIPLPPDNGQSDQQNNQKSTIGVTSTVNGK